MAKPQSFNKRENEKKKAAKRLEKQKKKEERKAGGVSSMDDMIAYVDANGNLVDTPPEETDREEINLEDIEVSVPKREAVEPEDMKGVVDYFNSSKGFGFIRSNGEKYFFHISSAPASIAEGNKVTFETERSTRGMNAVNIKIQ